tara:strand:+ start:205 stop:357 length:153 start_codon:yes stop_codon:yes gene_type:complete
MPFKSEKQKNWMFANEPEMAKRWAAEEKSLKKKKKKGPGLSDEMYKAGHR